MTRSLPPPLVSSSSSRSSLAWRSFDIFQVGDVLREYMNTQYCIRTCTSVFQQRPAIRFSLPLVLVLVRALCILVLAPCPCTFAIAQRLRIRNPQDSRSVSRARKSRCHDIRRFVCLSFCHSAFLSSCRPNIRKRARGHEQDQETSVRSVFRHHDYHYADAVHDICVWMCFLRGFPSPAPNATHMTANIEL